MRARALLILTGCLLGSSPARGQDGFVSLRAGKPAHAGLERTLTDSVRGSVGQVLQALARRADLALVFADDLPSLGKPAPPVQPSETVRDALRRVLRSAGLDLMVSVDGRAVLRVLDDPGTAGGAAAADPAGVPVILTELIVSPGTFSTRPVGGVRLDRAGLESSTQIAEDVYRAINRLPGVENNDNTSAFRVRGGPHDELYVSLDGLLLEEPFHLKDFDNALSVIDPQIIGQVTLSTGGFPARVGDRLTGVLEFTSAPAEPGGLRQIGLSLSTIRALGSGTFGNGRGDWLASIRRGYLDVVLEIADPETDVKPRFGDAYLKATWRWPSGLTLAAHALGATDDLDYQEDPDEPRIDSGYGTGYGWLTLSTARGAARRLEAVAAVGRQTWRREGSRVSELDGAPDLSVTDRRRLTTLSLRVDGHADWSGTQATSVGVEVRGGWADYGYFGWQRIPYLDPAGAIAFGHDTTAVGTHPAGARLGGYLSHRMAPWHALTLEAGVRAEHWAWLRQTRISPRLQAAWRGGERVTIRGAWGEYTQGEALHQLPVQDGVDQFAPVERAEHRVVGVEAALTPSLVARVEGFERRVRSPRRRFVNLDGAQDLFPEWRSDRARLDPDETRVRGVGFYLSQHGGRSSWSASYGWQQSRDRLQDQWAAREFDQRHSVAFDVAWRPSPPWLLTAAGVLHSGWPVTQAEFVSRTAPDGSTVLARETGPLNGARLRDYARFDVRLTREFRAGRGRIRGFIELFNLTNRANERGYNLDPIIGDDYQVVGTATDPEKLYPRLLGFGIIWELP